MKLNKKSFSERVRANSSTKKNGCGCINKDAAQDIEEEIEVKVGK